MMFIQIDSQTKYLSEDWLMSDKYDTYAIYTVFKAASKWVEGGYLKSYLSDDEDSLGLVDFGNDFRTFYSFKHGWLSAIKSRIVTTFKVLWDLTCLLTIVYAIQSNLVNAIS
jgi:hypothetical protein